MNKVAAARIAVLVKTAGLTPVQAALLVKAAADASNVQARMEKDAYARAFGSALGSRLTKLTPGLNRAWTRPGAAAGAPRTFSGAKLGKSLAYGGGTAVVGGHAYNDAANTQGTSYNPLTWHRGKIGQRLGLGNTFNPSEEDIFKRNQAGFNESAQSIKSQMDAAPPGSPEWAALNDKYQKGDFGVDHGWSIGGMLDGKMPDINPLNYRMGGLNPFATRRGEGYQGNMQAQQGALQGKYNAEMGKVGPQPGDPEMMKKLQEQMAAGDLLPHQHEAMQKQLSALEGRMKQKPGEENDAARQIKERMVGKLGPDGKLVPGGGAGMRWQPWKPPGATTAPTAAPAAGGNPSGNWHLGSRPRMPGYAQGYVVNPQDYRNAPQQPNYWGPIDAPGA